MIEPFKSYMEATTSGQVDQLWTKVECCSHARESEISRLKLWLSCLLSWLSGVAAEITRLSSYSGLYVSFSSLKMYTSMTSLSKQRFKFS